MIAISQISRVPRDPLEGRKWRMRRQPYAIASLNFILAETRELTTKSRFEYFPDM